MSQGEPKNRDGWNADIMMCSFPTHNAPEESAREAAGRRSSQAALDLAAGPRDADGFLCRPDDIVAWVIRVNWGRKPLDLRLDADGTVHLNGNFQVVSDIGDRLPVRFGSVSGLFSMTGGTLSSTAGLPRRVGGGLNLSRNRLTSLVGGPESVGGYCLLGDNLLTSLDGFPDLAHGGIDVSCNTISDLRGCPDVVRGQLNLSWNPVTRLPDHLIQVDGDLILRGAPLNPLVFEVPKLGGKLYLPTAPFLHRDRQSRRRNALIPALQTLLDEGKAVAGVGEVLIDGAYAQEAIGLCRLWAMGKAAKKRARKAPTRRM